MKAMILAAGLGTRLRPLTDHLPKALVPINGTPLLEIVIQRLNAAGFHEIIINAHHCAEQIVAFLEQKRHFGLHIRVSHEVAQVLDTGGGIKQAAWFFNDGQPFLVHNVDILSTLDLRRFYAAHRASDALATLAVQHRAGSRYLLFDRENVLCGWENTQTGARTITRAAADAAEVAAALTPLGFSGIHVLDPAIFALMPDHAVFSITELYVRLAAHHRIRAYCHDDARWMDVGRKAQLAQAGHFFSDLHR